MNNVLRKLISVGIELLWNVNGLGYYLICDSKLYVKDLINGKDGEFDKWVYCV